MEKSRLRLLSFLLSSLASGLSGILPNHFRVEATETRFRVIHETDATFEVEVEIETQDFWDEERSIKDSVETSRYSILNNTQVAITMVTHDVWPKIASQPTSLALPKLRWSDNKLEISFQLDGEDVLKLEPIDFNGLLN